MTFKRHVNTPLTVKQFAEAKRRIANMDKVDGGPEVVRMGCSPAIRTILLCLQAAMNRRDWTEVGEAYVMLQQMEYHYRPADQKATIGMFNDLV